MLLALGGVTEGAIHRGNVCRCVRKGDVLMAESTSDPGRTVHRRSKLVRSHQELGRPLRALKHGRIPVAHEAHLVVALCPQ